MTWSAVDEAAGSARARSVGDVLMKRRTQRVFEGTELPLHDFTELLEYLRRAVGDPETAPEFSAIELHLIAYGIEGLESGAWRLDLSSRSAQRRVPGRDTDREAMSRIMCGMPAALTAAGSFVFAVDLPYRRKQYPYERALRELYVDVARLAQWIILCGESLGIGSLITPATNDLELARLIDLGEHAAPIYTLTFGPHREKRRRQTP